MKSHKLACAVKIAVALWLAAATGFAADRGTVIVQDETWKPLVYEKDIVSGSVLDFSPLLDAPAGKHGFLTVSHGKFVFAGRPDTPVRFYGVNLVNTANYYDKAWCERLADRLARMGYNAVRLHHFDNLIVRKTEHSSVELDPARADQIDYLFFCLKQRGIYITTDLYTCRVLVKGEIPELPEQAVSGDTFKGLVLTLDSAWANWAAFSKNLLTHINPYTGLAWKDDPALVGISLVNEDTIFGLWYQKDLNDLYNNRRFGDWAQQRGIKHMTRDERQMLRQQFLVDTYGKAYAKMRNFVASLGVKAPITDQNKWNLIPLSLARAEYDYVDNHFYWDHPRFLGAAWRLPVRPMDGGRSVLSDAASAPGKCFPTRIFGKPMTITEFDYAYPNRFRAEGGAVAGAYASLQDWDALYRFAYAHSDTSVKEQRPSVFFDVAADPIKALSERIAILLFLRGDVRKASDAYPVVVSKHCCENLATLGEFPKDVWQLGLIGRTGTVPADAPPDRLPDGTVALAGLEKEDPKSKGWGRPFFPSSKEQGAIQAMIAAGAVDRRLVDLDQGLFTSSTGEISLDAKKQTFKVVTQRSETLIAPEGLTIAGKVMKIENRQSRGVFFAAACDQRKLTDSRRVLILHLTDSHCDGDKFNGPDMTVWEKNGSLPHLVRNGKARMTLQGDFAAHKLYAIDMTGKRVAELPLAKAAGGVTLELEVSSQGRTAVAYELVQE
jgi:hypothetical protein